MSNNYGSSIVKEKDGIEWEAPIVKDTEGITWDEPSKPQTSSKPTAFDNLMQSDTKISLPQNISEDTKTTAPQKFAKESDNQDYDRTSRAFQVAKKKSKYGMPTEQEVKEADIYFKRGESLETDDKGKTVSGGLEAPWISPEFAMAGGVRAVSGLLTKDALKVASGKGFMAGSIGGDVAAWGAHESVDKSLTDEFKQAHPVLSEAMKISAALVGGVAGGMAAERRYMQQYQTLLDDVKEGVVPPKQAEEVLRQDTGVQDIINKVETTRAKYAEERAMQPQPEEAITDGIDKTLSVEQIPVQQIDEVAPRPIQQVDEVAPIEQLPLSPMMERVNAKLQEMGHEPLIKPKPMPVQAQRIKDAQEIPVGGSEDATKAQVQQLFKPMPNSQYKKMTATERQAYDEEYQRALQYGKVDEAGEALDDFGQPLFSKGKEEDHAKYKADIANLEAKHGSIDDLDYDMMDISDRERTRLQRANFTIKELKNNPDDAKETVPNLKEVLAHKTYKDKLLKYSDAKPQINYAKGTVKIYRSAIGDIEPGDWVGLNRSYASGHGRTDEHKLFMKEVPLEDIRWQGADFNEWIYLPQKIVDAEMSSPMLSKFATPDGTTTQSVRTITRKFLGKQYNKLKDDLNIVQTFDDLPEDLRKRTGLNTVEVGGKPRGIYDPQTGKAHLIADSMTDKEVQSVIAHELLHRHIQSGRQVLGADYDTFVLRLKQLKEDKLVKEAMDAVRSAGTPVKHMNEETMAYLVEKYQYAKDISPKLKRFIADIVEKVKVFIAETAVKLGVKPEWLISKMSSDEIAQVLKSAAMKSSRAEVETTDALFSKAKEVIDKMPQGFKKTEAKKDFLELKTVQKNYDDFTEWFRRTWHDMYRPIVKMQNDLGIEEGSMIKYDVAGHRLIEKSKADFKMEAVTKQVEEIEKRIIESAKVLKAQPDEIRHLVDQYLISKHAPEYNKAVGEDLLGGAAGRSTQEATEIIKAIGSNREVYNAVRAIAKDMQAMAKQSLDVLLDAGVLNKEQYDKIKTKYKYYVPMHRVMPDDKDIRALFGGGGASVKGTGIKKRVGSRELEVADIMSNVMFTTKSAIDRARKNTNAIRLAELLKNVKNPNSPLHNSEIASMFEVKSVRPMGVDSNGIPIMEHVADDGMTLFYREDGKPKYIKFKNQTLANAALEKDFFLYVPVVAEVSRWMGAMYTRFNIGFAPRNFIRDTQEMAIFLSSLKDMGFKQSAVASSLAPRALKGVMDNMLGKENEWSKLYKQLKEDGGTMGGYHTLSKKDIEIDVDEIFKEAQNIRADMSGARRSIKKVLTAIDNYNQVFEDANRLAAYKAALDNGISRERSAWIARNATIDFARKGTATRMMSQFYIFFNPSIQGTAKLFRALKNPKTATVVAVSVGSAVFALNTYNDSVDKDWRKKVSPYDFKSSLCIILPNKDKFAYVVVPIAWGVRPVYQAFNEVYNLTKGEEKDTSERIGEVAKTFFDAYSPIQGGSLTSTLTPTILDPMLDIQANEKSLGGMIRPNWMKDVPQSEQVFKEKDTGKVRIDETLSGRMMHKATDIASDYTRIEYSPHDMDYALGAYFGGPYKLAKQAIDNMVAPITGDKVPPRGKPIVGDFYKTPEPEMIESREKGKPYKELIKKLQNVDATERKILIVEAINKIDDADQRKSMMFKLMSGGFDTKGISASNTPKFPQAKMVDGKMKQVTKEDIMLYHLRRGVSRKEAQKLSNEWGE